MPLETSWPMTTDFRGVPSLQANGSAGATGDAFPNGLEGRIEIVSDPARVRGNVMRSRLYETDALAGNGHRSEIANIPSLFDEYWYSFKFMLGDDWTSLNEPFSLAQLHDTPDGGDGLKTPNMLFALLSGHFRCIVPGPLPSENQVFNRYGSVGADVGVWHDVCMHTIWKTSGVAGLRELFFDGRPIYREFNIVTSYTDVQAPFFKMGVYDGLNANAGYVKRTAYYSDVRIWNGPATYEQGLNRQIAQPRRLTRL